MLSGGNAQPSQRRLQSRCDSINILLLRHLPQACRPSISISIDPAEGIGKDEAAPEELPFGEKDLCSLISNLLDNGIEACAEIGPEEGEKTLRFQIRQSGNYLFLRTENPVAPGKISPERRLTLQTTKADGSLHGYGTKIIQSIAEKYNGAAKFSQTENIFQVDVMLLLRERQAG